MVQESQPQPAQAQAQARAQHQQAQPQQAGASPSDDRGGRSPTSLLFVCIPFSGHLAPALAVATAAARRSGGGAAAAAPRVRFAGLAGCRKRVEAAGIEFVDLGVPPPELAAELALAERRFEAPSRSPAGLAAAVKHFALLQRCMLPPLLAALRGGAAADAGVIVADFVSWAGPDAAAVLGLPLVVLHQAPLSLALTYAGLEEYNLPSHVPLEFSPPFVHPEKMTPLQRALNPLLKRYVSRKLRSGPGSTRAAARAALGLPAPKGRAAFAVPAAVPAACHIVSGTMALETERPLPPGWHITGPHGVDFSGGRFPVPLPEGDEPTAGGDGSGSGSGAIAAFLRSAAAASEPVVYVATGTLAAPTQAQVDAFVGAMRAVEGARFVWSLPNACHPLLPGDMEGWAKGKVLVLPWAPQQALLTHPAVRLFVTHGGLNSTLEGLSAGLPLIVLPFFADQPINAQHVVNKGLGEQLDPQTLKAPALAAAVARLLADGATRARAAALGEELRRESGPDAAARVIEGFCAGGR